MTQPPPDLRLTLDQNFPIPLIDAVRDYLPSTVRLAHLKALTDECRNSMTER